MALASSPHKERGFQPTAALCGQESKLGFAVRWLGSPEASPRSHRMPCGDVPGRVHVSVASVAAGFADEGRLALAVFARHMPARRAALAGECGGDLLNPARGFLLQSPDQEAPAGGEDLPVQSGLGAHVPAGLGHRAFGRTGHMPHTQILDTDHIEPPGHFSGEFLGLVLAGIGLTGFQPGDRKLQLSTVVAATPRPSESALQAFQPPSPARGQPWAAVHLARGECGAYPDTPVHAHHLSRSWPYDRCGDRREGDVPAAGPIQLHPERFGLWDRLRPAEPHPPGLRDQDLSPVSVQPADLTGSKSYYPEPLVPTGFAPGGLAMRTVEIVRHGLREISQRLLLDHHTSRRQPPMLGACLRQLAAMLSPPRRRLAPGPPPGLLFDSEVPHEPSVSAMAAQRRFLRDRRRQPVANHGNMISKNSQYGWEGSAILLRLGSRGPLARVS